MIWHDIRSKTEVPWPRTARLRCYYFTTSAHCRPSIFTNTWYKRNKVFPQHTVPWYIAYLVLSSTKAISCKSCLAHFYILLCFVVCYLWPRNVQLGSSVGKKKTDPGCIGRLRWHTTGEHISTSSNQDQTWCANNRGMHDFRVHRGFWLLCLPATCIISSG